MYEWLVSPRPLLFLSLSVSFNWTGNYRLTKTLYLKVKLLRAGISLLLKDKLAVKMIVTYQSGVKAEGSTKTGSASSLAERPSDVTTMQSSHWLAVGGNNRILSLPQVVF